MTSEQYDVVICGGGLSGLTLALQLRQEHGDDLTIAVVERTRGPLPEAAHKLGESCVEMGSQYLESLGITELLEQRQIVKFGLRFFPGGGTSALHQRLEMGAGNEPRVRSWQLDRGRFENDVRELLPTRGIDLIEGAKIADIEVGPEAAPHVIRYATDGASAELRARWLVDATGRTGLLRRRLKNKTKHHFEHHAYSGWFRIEGRLDINDFVPADADTDWHDRHLADQRWRSTSHMMGDGYWMWIIPLASGHTSVGLVTHEEYYDFDSVRTLDRMMAFITEHEPQLAERLRDRQVMDFGCIKNYSYRAATHWSADRWALVGEAGSFTDPLYSPGTDLIALANTFTSELIAADRSEDADLAARTTQLEDMYASLVHGGMTVYRGNAPVFGHAKAMASKIYWDNFAYWSYPCQYFRQRMYRLSGEAHDRFKRTGARFVVLSSYIQQLVRHWALLAPEGPTPGFLGLPAFPSVVIDAHCALLEDSTPEEAQLALETRVAQAEQIVAELVLRVVQELGPERGAQLIERARLEDWEGLAIAAERLHAETLKGMQRRRALSPIARDVERALGRITRHADDAAARALLSPWVAAPEPTRATA